MSCSDHGKIVDHEKIADNKYIDWYLFHISASPIPLDLGFGFRTREKKIGVVIDKSIVKNENKEELKQKKIRRLF